MPLVNSPQLTSSLPSVQSIEMSHLQVWGTHWPSPHRNSADLHVCTFSRDEPHNFRDSSLPSLQSACPSHSWLLDRHLSDGPQEKAVQLWQDISSLPSPQWSVPSQRKSREMHRLLRQANSSFPHNSRPVMWQILQLTSQQKTNHTSAVYWSFPPNKSRTRNFAVLCSLIVLWNFWLQPNPAGITSA